MIKLTCPSCNGSLELPDDMNVAHCLYCGTRILLNEDKNTSNIQQYIKLSKVALDAKNYDEAIEYCNKALEIDFNNIDAWVDKALATFWLTTVADHKYKEAMSYLEKAESISPNEERIIVAINMIKDSYALWLNSLGKNEFNRAQEIYKSRHNMVRVPRFNLMSVAMSAVGKIGDFSAAKEVSKPVFISAMNLYIQAATIRPINITILNNINECARTADWIQWSNIVKYHISTLIQLAHNSKRNAGQK